MPKKNTPDITFQQLVAVKPMKMLITIVDHGRSELFLDYFVKNEVTLQLVLNGEGAHEKELANILGLDDVRKDVIISFVQAQRLPLILDFIKMRFALDKKERGIAFTIPLQSMIGVSVYKFLSNSTDLMKGSK